MPSSLSLHPPPLRRGNVNYFQVMSVVLLTRNSRNEYEATKYLFILMETNNDDCVYPAFLIICKGVICPTLDRNKEQKKRINASILCMFACVCVWFFFFFFFFFASEVLTQGYRYQKLCKTFEASLTLYFGC